ncbi:MAG: signal recognition particle protein Srp54 [Candidatus Thermoplasmatota archaeon]|nr:signal recognition particle protein Srp54 [Candidatus Thermoplasmatota archaeon]MBS3789898.1 signal recognition particle protein Srp54 [Candidatus Thermoplasmatota archaeon]
MALESLKDGLRNAVEKVTKASHVDKELIKDISKDIQRAMIEADIEVQLALELTEKIKERGIEEKPPSGMSAREHLIRIIHEEFVKILGDGVELELKPQTIMMVGLYGQGKTTTCGKLAAYFQKRGLNTALIAGDTHRPAAYDQLSQVAEDAGVPVYGDPDEEKAPRIVREGMEKFEDYDVVIIDTAGRHSLEEELIREIQLIKNVADPDEVILTVDASIGQQAGPQAKAFHDAVNVTKTIITKMDGSAKGGGALSAVAETDAPVAFIGNGERIRDLEEFDPKGFTSRLLGMGDIEKLLEKAEEAIDEDKAEETAKKMLAGDFDLKDMYEQMEMLTGVGPLQKIVDMLPMGPSSISEEEIMNTQEKLDEFRIIMDSMTEYEMENPNKIKGDRIKRIAMGSGRRPKDIRKLISHYKKTKKAIQGFSGNRKMRKQLKKQLESGNLNF